jgi:glycosyltransferase involved in cell wall biosynthesis
MEITAKEKKLISVVVYLHNDENTIVLFLEKILILFSKHFESFEIIVVNDCSFDNSIAKIQAHPRFKDYNISIVNMSLRQGLEISMSAGIDLAMGDFVYEFDDLTIDYDDALVMNAYNHIISGLDIVSVSPKKYNSYFSGMFYTVFNKFSRSRYKLHSERFRILSRRAINRAYSISTAIPYRKALYANSGLKLDTIKYTAHSKYTKKPKKENIFRNRMAINSLIIYTNLAFKISVYITLLLFAFTLLAGIYSLVIYLSKEKPIEGWTTLMLVISGSFSGLFFILAIIIKYLSLIVELVYSKKTYLVESVDKV